MSEPLDWNAKTIAEFRENQGRVGGVFEGTPMMYLPLDTEPDVIYVFATKAGAPTNPDWYHNLTAAGDGGFAEYARQTAGVRTIPVLELRRA